MDHARDLRSSGNLAGAWNDVVVLLRMARHLSEGATMTQGLQALAIEKEALEFAIGWATAPGQTPERLHAAIAAYRDLPRVTPTADIVRGEANLFERTMDLPSDEIKAWLLSNLREEMRRDGPVWAALWADMIITPWERERARRANRRFASIVIRATTLETWQQDELLGPGKPIGYDLSSTPLARLFLPNLGACLQAENRNEVMRRALVQKMTN